MDQYNIRVTNTTKIVLALVFVPVSVVPAILFMAVKFPNLPDWVVGTTIAVMMILALALTIYMVKRISPQALLALHNDGFDVSFPTKDFFTPSPFSIKISEVTNFFAEGKDGLYYLSFKTSVRPFKFNIEARSKSDEDLASFTELMGKVAQMIIDNNEQAEGTSTTNATAYVAKAHTITSVSMYESWWAKAISVFSLLVFVLILGMIAFAPDKAPDSWRLTPLVIFGVPFIYKVWYHNYRKKKKE